MHFFKSIQFYIIKALLFAGFLSRAYASSYTDLNLYQFNLESLKRFTTQNTQIFTGKPSLWVSFQPSCSSCKTLINNLTCLPKDVQLLAIGIGASKKELASTLRPLNFKGEGFMASTDLIKKISISATPTILIVNTNGNLLKRIVGVTDCEILKSYF